MTITITTTATVRRDAEVRLTSGDVLALLRAAGYDVPLDARVSVDVPRGGDYSGMELEVDAEAPVVVRWTVPGEVAP